MKKNRKRGDSCFTSVPITRKSQKKRMNITQVKERVPTEERIGRVISRCPDRGGGGSRRVRRKGHQERIAPNRQRLEHLKKGQTTPTITGSSRKNDAAGPERSKRLQVGGLKNRKLESQR